MYRRGLFGYGGNGIACAKVTEKLRFRAVTTISQLTLSDVFSLPPPERKVFPPCILLIGQSFPGCFVTLGVTVVLSQGNKSWENCVIHLVLFAWPNKAILLQM